MKAAVKQAWVEALRSGDYQQGKDNLIKMVDVMDQPVLAYCCLGVLTDLCIKSGEEADRIMYDPDDPARVLTGTYDDSRVDVTVGGIPCYEHTDNDLHPVVAEWAGITAREPGERTYNPTIDGVAAIERNDQRGESFAQIADAIERDVTL